MKSPHPSLSLPGRPQLFLVIPTGAYPDFLLRAASDVHVCGSPQREPHTDHQSHGSPQEIRGSAVERSAVSPSHTRCRGHPPSPLSSQPERNDIFTSNAGPTLMQGIWSPPPRQPIFSKSKAAPRKTSW